MRRPASQTSAQVDLQKVAPPKHCYKRWKQSKGWTAQLFASRRASSPEARPSAESRACSVKLKLKRGRRKLLQLRSLWYKPSVSWPGLEENALLAEAPLVVIRQHWLELCQNVVYPTPETRCTLATGKMCSGRGPEVEPAKVL